MPKPTPSFQYCKVCSKPFKNSHAKWLLIDGVCLKCRNKNYIPPPDTPEDLALTAFEAYLKEKKDDIYMAINGRLALTDSERIDAEDTFAFSTGKRLINRKQYEESLVRWALGQYPSEISEYLSTRYNIQISPNVLTKKFLNVPLSRNIVERLRDEIKTSQIVIPVANPAVWALRLENLYLRAERENNVKDCVQILRTAAELLADKKLDGHNQPQINILNVVNRIVANNAIERGIRVAEQPTIELDGRKNGNNITVSR